MNKRDVYRDAAVRLVVARICRDAGFAATDGACVGLLVELLRQFMHETAALLNGFADVSQRTRTNLMDLRLLLGELGVTTGSLRQIARAGANIPPGLAAWPATGRRRLALMPPMRLPGAPGTEAPPAVLKLVHAPARARLAPALPPFAPALPSDHTFCATAPDARPPLDPVVVRSEAAETHRRVEHSLGVFLRRARAARGLAGGLVAGSAAAGSATAGSATAGSDDVEMSGGAGPNVSIQLAYETVNFERPPATGASSGHRAARLTAV